MFKKLITILILFLILFPSLSKASETENVFSARVVEIIKQEKNILPDGSIAEQQNVRLRGIDGEFKGQEIVFEGINSFDVAKKVLYKEGDKVIVLESKNDADEATYYITDYVRTDPILYLFILFILILIIVGGFKGLRSLVSLAITFLVVIKYIIPQILVGASPIIVTLIGSFVILFSVIYITEGFNKNSHIAVASIFISLFLTVILSKIFVGFAYLSGFAGEESVYLISVVGGDINFQGLLLAGVIIGTLGVLDDVVISQVVTVEQINKANSGQSKNEIYKKAYEVGVSHISSMTNTLFLAYAGASLPLLILFISGSSAYGGWLEVVNNEQIATEIVRTLAGSIGLILAVPISTAIAVYSIKNK